MTTQILDEIAKIGMIPVLSIDKEERALPLAQALKKGGLPLMEVMFRTDAAAGSIRRISEQMPDFLVGAGTVLTVEQARQAVACGAKFLVSPGFNPEVCKAAIELNVPIVPGCTSPTEVEAARVLGLHVLKFFPAVENGGVSAMRLLSGPYPDVSFVPTGDLTRALCSEYLAFGKVAAAGGDFMLSYDDIHSDNYEKIASDVQDTILGYLNFHIAHMGMNANDKDSALSLSGRLASALHLNVCAGNKSAFAGKLFEVMYEPFYHEKGHVAIGTFDATRAYYYLKRCGMEFYEDTVSRDAAGRIIAAYMKEDFAGFALHLLQD